MDTARPLEEQRALNAYLEMFVTHARKEKINRALQRRQRYLTVVLEDIFQPHNASAVLRNCDAFGIQDVHIIENRNRYRINPDVELGTAQWLSIRTYNEGDSNTAAAIGAIKKNGYRILATTPHGDDQFIQEVSLDKGPIALLFGTELTGLSGEAIEMADEFVRIPMQGFVESFNISVSVAISLYALDEKLRSSKHIDWQLGEAEKEAIRYQWLSASLEKSATLEAEYYRKHK